MLRRLAALLALVMPSFGVACSLGGEGARADVTPRAGACPHRFELQRDDGVLTNVGVVEVYWGSWWSTEAGRAARDTEDTTWATLADDPSFYRALQAYAPSGTVIHGRYLASAAIATAQGDVRSVSRDALEDEIAKALAAGVLPSRSGDMVPIHVVHLPPGVRGPELDRSADMPDDYSAYHASMQLRSGERVPYAVSLFDDDAALAVDQSHELYEVITNPFGLGWHDHYEDARGAHDEIADVCQGAYAYLHGFAVQRVWSAAACACVDPQTL